MHGCVAILPAFSSDEYYTDRASSTMGAALISATPLIATPEMLRVYSFLSRESVFLVDPTLPYVEVSRRPETCCSLPNQPGAVGGVTGHVGMIFKAQDPPAAPQLQGTANHVLTWVKLAWPKCHSQLDDLPLPTLMCPRP
ncbi:hypothetical protein ACKKBG_A11060 [Auxenochlorella protothecoides x Auxenochlorella symbiontica]